MALQIIEESFRALRNDSNLANAIATLFSAITAFAALLISAITVAMQRSHNRISIRPVPEVTVADYENSLRVKIRNNGIGPLFIKSLCVHKGDEVFGAIIECMPILEDDRLWTHFAMNLDGRTIQPNGSITLLELTQENFDNDFPKHRDRIRGALKGLVIFVDYSDMYQSNFQQYSKGLEWFGRKDTNKTEPRR